MKINKRLIISNTFNIVIPIIITALVAAGFIFTASFVFDKDINYSTFKKLATIKLELVNASTALSDKEPEELAQYLNQRLLGIKGKFVIIKNNEIQGFSKGLDKIDAEKFIDKNFSNSSYFKQEVSINFKDGVSGIVILLAPINGSIQITESFVVLLGIVFIISVLVVNIISSYLFSKRISGPVESLKTAVSEISRGNLQCEIVETGDEEIKDLCRDLEIMRIQLKDSINMKIKYDDNRNVLISSISHDLKTPITSIRGYVEGLLDGVASTPEKVESYLKIIYSKTERIDAMIDDLLLYSKLDLNKIPFNFEKTQVEEYFDFCITECIPEFDKSNIKLKLKSDLQKPAEVMIDRERMRRVIMNILDNSRKYMDKSQGEIEISFRETNLSIIIELKDNGSGIEDIDIDKIFDRFYRSDTARSEASGSGLGLAIAKQIVEGHKGKIWAIGHGKEGISIMISLAKLREEKK